MKERVLAGILGITVLLTWGCAKRAVVGFDALQTPAEVELDLRNGKHLKGIAAHKAQDALWVVPSAGDTLPIARAALEKIQVYPPVYDEAGQLITRAEIQREKNSRNTLLYTIGGGALSFGASLFLSSVVYRSGDDSDFKVVNPISIGGGLVGTGVFHYLGRKRDRLMAIERIKDRRKEEAEKLLEEKRKEKERLLKQIEELKKEKARIEAEKKRLKKKKKQNQ
ncbi:MAG TPA: hypothetical protein ENI85_03745 [Deltaproteobacteria bacterium]|nr:hypothetical protein [Deltaproteobacteria bacterium]